MNTLELLDAAIAAQGLPSDYALAAKLGVTRGALSSYRTGRSNPDDAIASRLAGLAGLDAGVVAAWMQAERARTAEARTLWEGIAARLQATAAPVLAVILSVGIVWSPDAQARAAAGLDAVASTDLVHVTKRYIAALFDGLETVLGILRRAAVPMVLPCSI